MNKDEIKALIKNINSKGLYTAIIILLSPVSDQIEERHIYADSNMECIHWCETTMEALKAYDIPCISYINGKIDKTFRQEKIDFDF